jgi:hypothetical protein
MKRLLMALWIGVALFISQPSGPKWHSVPASNWTSGCEDYSCEPISTWST